MQPTTRLLTIQSAILILIGVAGILDAVFNTPGNKGGIEAMLGGIVVALGVHYYVKRSEL